jgi:hypothetical protein
MCVQVQDDGHRPLFPQSRGNTSIRLVIKVKEISRCQLRLEHYICQNHTTPDPQRIQRGLIITASSELQHGHTNGPEAITQQIGSVFVVA